MFHLGRLSHSLLNAACLIQEIRPNGAICIDSVKINTFNTVNADCPTRMYFRIHPQGWINNERMTVHFLELRCIRLYLPPTLRFPVDFALWKSPGPLEISCSSGNLSVVGNAQPNTSHFSAVYIFILDTPDM